MLSFNTPTSDPTRETYAVDDKLHLVGMFLENVDNQAAVISLDQSEAFDEVYSFPENCLVCSRL